jgi:DNA (cytosine-5)-methyltransferase 1
MLGHRRAWAHHGILAGMPTSVIDLFCGVGGMTHGFTLEGFDVVAGVDVDNTCRYAYEKNNGSEFVEADVTELKARELAARYPAGHTRILIGCAPCQPFSLYTNRKSPDDKWRLLLRFADLIEQLNPDVVSMENVPLLKSHDVFRQFVRRLAALEYFVTHVVADGPSYGIPQSRKRLVVFASRFGAIDIVRPTHRGTLVRTVRDAIGNLPAIKAGEISRDDPLHRSRGLTPRNLERIRATPAGGAWEDWDERLQLACHKKASGKTFRSVYGRMKWDEPSPVITTQCIGIGNGRFGHPEQDRAISLREAALLQSFPQSYNFIDPSAKTVSAQAIARQIGNAVPVRLGQIVARSISRHLQNANA